MIILVSVSADFEKSQYKHHICQSKPNQANPITLKEKKKIGTRTQKF